MDYQLGLRQGRYRVSLIGINSQYEPPLQFALCYPNNRNPYADIITSWGGDPRSPREPQQNTIDIPLDTRTQTFLSHQVSPELAQSLRGFTPITNHGRQGSTNHQVEINTHKSNQLSIREIPRHQSRIHMDEKLRQRESIVTSLAGNDTLAIRLSSTARR